MEGLILRAWAPALDDAFLDLFGSLTQGTLQPQGEGPKDKKKADVKWHNHEKPKSPKLQSWSSGQF